MKQFFKRWSYSFSLTSIIFILLSFVILKRLNINVAYLKITIGAILISLLIDFSITIFNIKKCNSILKIILAFIVLVPVIFVTKRIFGVLLFRVSIVIFIFAFLCTIIYSLAIFVVAKKYKKEQKEMNNLLKNKKEEE